MRFSIELHESDQGYDVSVPALPGCRASGKTEAEAILNVRCAIVEFLGSPPIATRNILREVDAPVESIPIDTELLSEASMMTGCEDRDSILNAALQALIERESARRLAALGGSEPNLTVVRRRR